MIDDRDLRDLFQAQRSSDASRAGSFARTLAPRTRQRPLPRAWLALAAAAVLVASIGMWRLTLEPEPAFVFRTGELRVPTDYLLELASFPRAGAIPPIGVVDWFPLEPASESTRRTQ